jgi:PAS domain S-box-containing protein
MQQQIKELEMPEAEDEQAEGYLKSLFNNSPIGICIVQNREFLYANRRFQELSGYSDDELLRTNPQALIHPDDRSRVRENAVKMLKGERSSPCSYRVVRKNGELRWVIGTVSSIQYQGRQSILEHYMDITGHMQAKRALKESEEFGSSLLKTSAIPILVLNPDSSIKYVNPALEMLTGFSRRELNGRKPPYPWWPEEMIEKYSMLLKQAMLKGAKGLEIVFQRKNGERFWVDVTTTPKRDNEEFKYYLINWVDITERKRTEVQLLRSAKASSLGLMAGGIAHELRNPLGIISATAELLEHNDSDQLRMQCVQKIRVATKRASLIIENLLRFAHSSDQQMTQVDVQAILEDALDLLYDQMAMHRVTLQTELQPDLPSIHSNPELLEQVFVNMILNALNSMPDGGALTVTTRSVPDGKVEIRFSDTGVGIPQENLPSIFDPFFTTQPVGKGAGLGLAISYSIIRRQCGTIEVASQVGKGSTFTVRLPAKYGKRHRPQLVREQTNYKQSRAVHI